MSGTQRMSRIFKKMGAGNNDPEGKTFELISRKARRGDVPEPVYYRMKRND